MMERIISKTLRKSFFFKLTLMNGLSVSIRVRSQNVFLKIVTESVTVCV